MNQSMAFVPQTIKSAFFGTTSLSSSLKCPRAIRSKLPTPRMAFSSIDMPETQVFKTDSAFDTKEAVIHACYKQIFGNAYIMEEELDEISVHISEFKLGIADVRELIRAMAKSEAYRKRFFARTGPFRFVELNLKHFLGRGPNSFDEVSYHVQLLQEQGYEAEIDSYLDSREYEERFGPYVVPRFIFKGAYENNDHFNRLCITRKHWDGCSTSTVSGSTAPGKPIPSQLTMGRKGYVNGFVGVMKGLPAGFRPEPGIVQSAPSKSINDNAGVKVRTEIAQNLYLVYEESPKLFKEESEMKTEPEWKKAAVGTKSWNKVWN